MTCRATERAASTPRGRLSAAAAAGFVTEPWEARKWLKAARPETRPTRRSDDGASHKCRGGAAPKSEPTAAIGGGFSPRLANQPERVCDRAEGGEEMVGGR